MKINTKVPRRQQPVLDYMRNIKPVSRTLDDLIKAVAMLGESKLPENKMFMFNFKSLPKRVRAHKCFDGGHTGTDTEMIMGFARSNRTLLMRVQRGYLDQHQGGTYKERLQRHLDKSNHFMVAFVSSKKITNGNDWWNPGFEFLINRDGTLYAGGASNASSINVRW